MQPAEQHYRFRGVHRPGYDYAERDVVASGRAMYACVKGHVAGDRSAPGFGTDWGQYWVATDGITLSVAGGAAPATAIAEPQSSGSVLTVPRTPLATSVPRSVASLPAAPPEPPGASTIVDDSSDGALSVAFSLDALRQAVRLSARREWVESELSRLRELLERTLARIEAGLGPALTDDPVQAEAWRRKGLLLGATSRAEAQAMEMTALREIVQLLRKRDRGGSFTAAEAIKAAHLDNILSGLALIDGCAETLRLAPASDPTDDLHWRAA